MIQILQSEQGKIAIFEELATNYLIIEKTSKGFVVEKIDFITDKILFSKHCANLHRFLPLAYIDLVQANLRLSSQSTSE